MRLPPEFYQHTNTKKIARQLLGKILYTRFNNQITSGIITETEAYEGANDKACHAWGGRYTQRTKTMYEAGGISYVYLCYGLHHMFNVVTHQYGQPHAILVRSIKPVEGIPVMEKRKNAVFTQKNFAIGPGNVCKILGINLKHNALDLTGTSIWIEDNGVKTKNSEIEITPRIGIEYAGEDARRMNRFVLNPVH